MGEPVRPQYGKASDVYSIGCILFAMVIGKFCFGEENGAVGDIIEKYQKMCGWQFKGRDVTGWCKLGNLGLGFLKCLSPFQTDNQWLAKELKDTDPEVRHLLKKMLKKDPGSRWTLQRTKRHDFFTKHEGDEPGTFRWFDERPLPTLYDMAKDGIAD